MINAIGEATMQHLIRTNYNSEMFDKEVEVRQINQTKEHRPVEKSEDGEKSEMKHRFHDNTRTKNSLEEGQIIVEKYDEDGKLIRKIPPGYVPFGERA